MMVQNDRLSRDQWGLQLAAVTAKRGTCCRRQVGCVLVDFDGRVLATGYNGRAKGERHCNDKEVKLVDIEELSFPSITGPLLVSLEKRYPFACKGAFVASGTQLDACEAIHAEQNALLQCPDVRQVYTAYLTCSPCVTCVKLFLNTGCRRIVFAEPYAHSQAKDLWYGPERVWVHLPLEK